VKLLRHTVHRLQPRFVNRSVSTRPGSAPAARPVQRVRPVGSILAPTIIGLSAASLGFAGVFGLTTAVLAAGVLCVLVFGLSTAGRSLEELTEHGVPKAAAKEMTK
jgi:hypothetical protein